MIDFIACGLESGATPGVAARCRRSWPSPWLLQDKSLEAFSSRVEGIGVCLCWFLWGCFGGNFHKSVKRRSDKWWHESCAGVLALKVTRKRPKLVNSGMFCPELANPNNLTVMKWKVCGEKQMLWLLQCYYIHKIYFIGGEFTQGVMRFLLYTLFITA